MDIGMMWFDNSKVPLDAKLLKAAEYYARKYGKQPDRAFVSLKELGAEQVESNGIRVDAMGEIMPGHLWIGVENE